MDTTKEPPIKHPPVGTRMRTSRGTYALCAFGWYPVKNYSDGVRR